MVGWRGCGKVIDGRWSDAAGWSVRLLCWTVGLWDWVCFSGRSGWLLDDAADGGAETPREDGMFRSCDFGVDVTPHEITDDRHFERAMAAAQLVV